MNYALLEEQTMQMGILNKNEYSAERLLTERKKLGAFYTPEVLSQILASWAIRDQADSVLEPSFGGCGFLHSARCSLEVVGALDAKSKIFGCDVDPIAFQYLGQIFSKRQVEVQFIREDFLKVVAPSGWPKVFDVILANPPYIPFQKINRTDREALAKNTIGVVQLPGRASMWAYFMSHAISFLAENGRMAWVLPGAFLQADYAQPLRDYLGDNFQRVGAFLIRDRIFKQEGTDEETIILLAEGYKSKVQAKCIELGEVESIADLENTINKWRSGDWVGDKTAQRPAILSLNEKEKSAYKKLVTSKFCKNLGEFAKIQIGIVTGANDFFVLSKDGVKKASLRIGDCKPILSKYLAVKGLEFTNDDHLEYVRLNGRGYLTALKSEQKNARLQRYFSTFDPIKKKNIRTFEKRSVWTNPDDGKNPDGFFPVMHHDGPRIALNAIGCTSTNTIHRVYFSDQSDADDRKLVCISLLTSFSQLSAELVGRRYGSGVLKHEPREAERIELLMPPVDKSKLISAFHMIDSALRRGDEHAACQFADELIYGAADISHPKKLSDSLIECVSNIRGRRRPVKG